MADMWFDVDAAITEAPVNIMPLIDDTDFKTIEDAVAYNAAGMALFWHFVTSAGAYTVTAVTPTTAGTYDWTDQGTAGIYTIEIPASGGASINNDTEGYGWFTGKATGVLPWRGPIIGFRAAAINDSLCDTNTTGLVAPTVAARTLDISAGGEAGLDWANVGSPTTTLALTGTTIATTQKVDIETIKTNPVVNAGTVTFPTTATLASTTNITAGTITTATNLTTNNDKTGYGVSSTAVQAIWDALTSALTTSGSIGKYIIDALTPLTIGTADSGSTTTLADSALNQSATDHWKWQALIAKSGTNAGLGALITAFDPATDTLTFTPAFPAAVGAGMTYEILPATQAILAGLTHTGAVIPWNAAWDAEVQSEVDDALNTAIAELGVAAPTATPTIRTGLMLLYMALRNKLVVQTSGTDAIEIYNDAGTKICAKLITDDSADYTEAKAS